MSKHDDIEIPPEFFCAVLKKVMDTPITLECCQQKVDYTVIDKLKRPERGAPETKCPCCNTAGTLDEQHPNWRINAELKARIEEFKSAHPDAIRQYNARMKRTAHGGSPQF